MGNMFTFDAVLKRVFVLVLASIILMNFPGLFKVLPTVHAETPEHAINVYGYFYLNGNRPIRCAHVTVYDRNDAWFDLNLGETTTDEHGYFRINGIDNTRDIEDDYCDVFAEAYAENDAVKVLNQPYFLLGGRYSFESREKDDVLDGDVDLGNNYCPSDEEPGFTILMGITYGWNFMLYETGNRMPQVTVFYSDIGFLFGLVSASYYYNGFIHKGLESPVGVGAAIIAGIFAPLASAITWLTLDLLSRGMEGIHIHSGDQDNVGALLHEYGHFVMDKFGDFWPPFSELIHYGDVAYDTETAWLEGWAHLFSSAAREWNHLSCEGLGSSNPGLSITNDLAISGDRVEGAVAGALWELHKFGHVSFGSMLNLEATERSFESGVHHPYTIHDFWTNYWYRYVSEPNNHINYFWYCLNRHGIYETDFGEPRNPVSYSASETPGVNPPQPIREYIDISWDGASDDISGIRGYSFIWDNSPYTIPPKAGLGDANYTFGTNTMSPKLTEGSNWYFHVRAEDNVGNWAQDAYHVGPFLHGGGTPQWSNMNAEPAYVKYDNETDYVIFKVNWYDESGIKNVTMNFWRDDKFQFQCLAVPVAGTIDPVGNGQYTVAFSRNMWINYIGHQIIFQSTAYPNEDPTHAGPRLTIHWGGPRIEDDDLTKPTFENPTSDGNVWDNDTRWDTYTVGVKVTDPAGISVVKFRYRVGDAEWSDWKPFNGLDLTYYKFTRVALYDIPRSELITPTTHPGSAIYFQVYAEDNDDDRGIVDRENSTSPVYIAGFIQDDDVEPPTLFKPSVQYLKSIGVVRMKIYAEDPKGISSIKFRFKVEEKDGWPNDYTSPWWEHTGDMIELHMDLGLGKRYPQTLKSHYYWYDIPLSVLDPTGSGNIDKRLYWQVNAYDDDNDLLGDEASIIKEFVYAPCTLAEIKFHSEALRALHLMGNGRSPAAYIEIQSSNVTSFDASSIDTGSILVNGTIPVDLNISATVGDYNNDGKSELMICFNRTTLSNFILSKGIKYGNVALTINGLLNDGTPIEGNVIVKVSMPGDLNSDGRVDVRDVAPVSAAFGSHPGHPRWNPDADQNEDNRIDLKDVALTARNFGKKYA